MKKRAISLLLLIVMLISLVPAQAFATDTVTEDPTVISDVADAAAEETGLTEDEPVPEEEVEIIPLPEEEYEEIVEEPEPTADENDAADGESENSEDGEDAGKDAEAEETDEDAEPEENEDKLFPGMPEGYTLSAEQIAGKQALNAYGVVDTLCEAVAGVDYADGEVFFLADTLEYAQTVAEAYGAELTEYDSGVATLKLNGATVLDAVTAAADMSSNMPIVEAKYICKTDPVIETDGGDVSTYAYRDKSGVSVNGSWTKWFESTSSPDTYMSSPGNWDYQYMHDVVNTYEAWGVTKGKGVTVAVVDSGVYAHEDIGGNLVGSDSINSGWTDFLSAHGTHVAGIIAAKMGNSTGGAGIAPEAHIYSERIMENISYNDGDVAKAVNRVISAKNAHPEFNIKVMNMSIGGYVYSYYDEVAIRNAINSGITVVVSMGNDGSNIQCYPAAYNIPGLIAVQSSTVANTLSSFSNYGAWADVTAPGSDIMSTVLDNGYGMKSGTSMAAPVVSGVCALYLSVYPNASPAQVEAAIKKATNKGIIDASKLFNAENKAPTITAQYSKGKDGSLPYGSYISINAADSSETIIYTVGSQTPSIKNGVVTGTVVEGNSVWLQLTSANGFTVGKNVSVKAAAVNGFGMMSKVKTFSVKVGYANPTGVEIIDAPETLIPGKSFTLSAKVSPAEASQKIIWSIDKGACAGTSISKTGALKTGKNDNGTITVYAYSEGNTAKFAQAQIKIAPVDATKKINILCNGDSQKSLTLGINSSLYLSVSLTAVSYKASAPTVPVYGEDYAWKSSNTKVATVDEDGIVKAVGLGSATITCTAKDGTNVKATQAVKVLTCADEMSISGFSTVAAGKTTQYKANLELLKDSPFKSVNYKTVEWSIDSNQYGIWIDSRGKVTVPAGTPNTQFTIRAQSGPTASAVKTVTVSAAITQVKIIESDSYFGGLRTYAKDGSLKQATLFSTDAFDGNNSKWFSEIDLGLTTTPSCEVEWTSSNEKVATVEDGVVKDVAAGTAKITCKATDAGRKSASVNIVVVNPASSVNVASQTAQSLAYSRGTLASGKSVKNTVTLGDAYGTPTVKKVAWSFRVERYSSNNGELSYVGDCTSYVNSQKLISINKSGQLTASKNAYNSLRRSYGSYDFIVSAVASATDGSGLSGLVQYDLTSAPISKLQVSYNRRLYTSISISYLCKDGYYIDLPVYGDGYSFADFTIKSSKPDVAGAILAADSYGYPVVRIIPGHKAGTATITLTATDGSNKKATVTIKVI